MNATNLTLEAVMTKKGAVAVFTTICVIILNGISLVVVINSKVINSKIKVCFIGQLLTDFVLGTMGFAISFSNIIDGYPVFYLCLIANNIGFICAFVTRFMAIIQALDRFLVLRCTFSYTAWITTTKITFLIVVVYVMTSVIFSIVFNLNSDITGCSMISFGNRSGYILIGCVLSFNIGMAFCLHLYIWIKVKGHLNKINSVGFCEEVVFSAKERRNLATMLITVCLITVCYLPSILTVFYLAFFSWEWEKRLLMIQGPFPAISMNLYLANSFINPIVYIWRLKSFRVDCFQKLFQCFCKNSDTSPNERSAFKISEDK